VNTAINLLLGILLGIAAFQIYNRKRKAAIPDPIKSLRQSHKKILKLVKELRMTVDDLVAAVAAEDTVIDSAIAFINGLEQQLADALSGATLPPAVQTKVDALFADINAKKDALATAITTPPTP
jgi:hypothetical protein